MIVENDNAFAEIRLIKFNISFIRIGRLASHNREVELSCFLREKHYKSTFC